MVGTKHYFPGNIYLVKNEGIGTRLRGIRERRKHIKDHLYFLCSMFILFGLFAQGYIFKRNQKLFRAEISKLRKVVHMLALSIVSLI